MEGVTSPRHPCHPSCIRPWSVSDAYACGSITESIRLSSDLRSSVWVTFVMSFVQPTQAVWAAEWRHELMNQYVCLSVCLSDVWVSSWRSRLQHRLTWNAIIGSVRQLIVVDSVSGRHSLFVANCCFALSTSVRRNIHCNGSVKRLC